MDLTRRCGMKIGIIGAGSVGGALGRGWARAGHEVTFGVR
ncbi:MAG TPA: NAD(P)-binding domain-containing protein, partial [Thermoanaerobaculia bacterium]|nr:NAD(P)-binding domain-containing protein [Thermoanaerobaculia bacterium]